MIVFDDVIADIINDKTLNQIGSELFIWGRKLNISTRFITQTYFPVLNCTHYFVTKIPNKRELQQIAITHSSDINSKDLIHIYKRCNSRAHSFLVIDTTLASDNPLGFRKNLLERIEKLIMTIDDKIRD